MEMKSGRHKIGAAAEHALGLLWSTYIRVSNS